MAHLYSICSWIVREYRRDRYSPKHGTFVTPNVNDILVYFGQEYQKYIDQYRPENGDGLDVMDSIAARMRQCPLSVIELAIANSFPERDSRTRVQLYKRPRKVGKRVRRTPAAL